MPGFEIPCISFSRIHCVKLLVAFLKYLVEFANDMIWAWIFPFGRFLNYKFNLFNNCLFGLSIVFFSEFSYFV